MSRIRKLYFFDKKKVQDIVSFLDNKANDNYINNIMFNPFMLLHYFLPLRFKYLPESYVLKENKTIRGLITISPTNNKNVRMEIQKLFFEENAYSDAEELVQFVVSKYKAMGAFSIIIKVDDYMTDLLSMLVLKCKFCQISYEKLWKINDFPLNNNNEDYEFSLFRNSDKNLIANLYNDSVLPHFRPLLSKEPEDFTDNIFKGLTYYNEYKYVFKDNETKNIAGLLDIKTSDDKNFIIDIIQSSWLDVDLSVIINFAINQVRKRRSDFNVYLKTKRYTNFCEKYEKYCLDNKFLCVQNQLVLTNSSANVLKVNTKVGKYTVLNNLCPNNIVPTNN